MKYLPPELTNLIISHLPPPLAPYATVSQQWQHAIESRTFCSVYRISTLLDDKTSFTKFKSAFGNENPHGPRRRVLIRSLRYRVILPSPSQKRLHKMQGNREAALNNKAYTQAVIDLFNFLSTWSEPGREDVPAVVTPNLRLEIYAESLVDDYDGKPDWDRRFRNRFKEIAFDADMPAALHGGKMPQAPRVVSLEFPDGPGRRMAPSALGVFAMALPNVQRVEVSYYPVGRRLMNLRREARLSLADSLLVCTAELKFLTRLKLYIEDGSPSNHGFYPGNMLDVADGERDRFSVALRKISQLPAMRVLDLDGDPHVLSAAMFEDAEGVDSGSWPSLQELKLCMCLTTPDGRWCVTGDPECEEPEEEDGYWSDYSAASDTSDFAPQRKWDRQDGASPYHQWRTKVDENTFVPFMMAMIRAMGRMPKLKMLQFYMNDFGLNIEGTYHSKETDCPPSDSLPNTPSWKFYLEQGFADWEFSPELKSALTGTVGEGNVRIQRSFPRLGPPSSDRF
ncbi:hypothetical protein QBC44DRAFT_361789 [Cladorrhinum sp. PSN332]|nr:hypothetical protein QBC44DRAFT_361789 [Cladorrhinum sp. PSN332]